MIKTHNAQRATRNALLRLIAAVVMVAGGLLGVIRPGGAAPVAQKIDIGPVGAIALDGSGNGWAWAAPAPQTFATNFLLRIEAGRTAWRRTPVTTRCCCRRGWKWRAWR